VLAYCAGVAPLLRQLDRRNTSLHRSIKKMGMIACLFYLLNVKLVHPLVFIGLDIL